MIPDPDDPRWSQMITDDPRWSQMIPEDPRMVPDDPRRDDARWCQMISGETRWYQMISDEMISEDPRRDDPRWFQTHMVPDDPNAIWGLSLESFTNKRSLTIYVRSLSPFRIVSILMENGSPTPQTPDPNFSKFANKSPVKSWQIFLKSP